MTARRAVSHLAALPPPSQLTGFPTHEVSPAARLFRCHGLAREPWWFASDGGGRFDLAGPQGSCYVAESPVVALLESWAGLRVIPSYLARARTISELTLPVAVTVADATVNRAAAFGVTSELFTTADYPLSQLWAAALSAAGFAGIRYWARHDLRHDQACLALFSTAGVADWAAPDRAAVSLLEEPTLLAELEARTGSLSYRSHPTDPPETGRASAGQTDQATRLPPTGSVPGPGHPTAASPPAWRRGTGPTED